MTSHELETGERLKCRKCGEIASMWSGVGAACSNDCCEPVVGQKHENMIHDQALYFEAKRYRDQVERAGSKKGISVSELVKKKMEMFKDCAPYWPLHGNLIDPGWPFHF